MKNTKKLLKKLFKFIPFTFWLGIKFVLHSKKAKHIKVITLTTIIGLALGVTALITVLSIMDGFIYTAKNRITSILPHITIDITSEYYTEDNSEVDTEVDIDYKIKNFTRIINNRIGKNNIKYIYPSYQLKGFITNNENLIPIYIKALPKEVLLQKLASLDNNYVIYNKSELTNQLNRGVIISKKILDQLSNKNSASFILSDNFSRYYNTKVVAAFDSTDPFIGNIVLMDIEHANEIFNNQFKIQDLNIDLVYASNAEYFSDKLITDIPLAMSNWTQYASNYFNILIYTKQMMFLLLSFIIIVAMFNLIATLTTVLNQKRPEIAILKTIGADNKLITRLFFSYGTIVTTIGLFFGLILGVLLASNISLIATIIERILDYKFVNPQMYFIDYLPSKISGTDILNIIVVVYITMLCSLIYPARKAAKLLPADALRYE